MSKWFTNNSVIILTVVLLLAAGVNPQRWANKKVIDNDIAEYYAYLPASLIYHDLTFKFKDDIPIESKKKIWTIHDAEKDIEVIKMTMGVSVLNIPFFYLGHTIALISNHPADGYSPPYQAAIYFGNLFYVILGLFFLRKILRRHFTNRQTNWTLAAISLGTNLFYYGSFHPGMSHPYSFFIITLFLYFTELWHERTTSKRSIIIGLLVGLTLLLRASNIIIVLLFIFYGIYNKRTLINKLHFFTNHYYQLLLIILFTIVAVSPQFIYWKIITGEWYYYTYGEEGFFFTDPEILKGIFSFRKGWLIYTPVMIFALAGMLFLNRLKEYIVALPATIIISIYIIFSWWVWWYAGSFSCRPIIDYYGILAIPLALFVSRLESAKKWLSITMKIVFILLFTLNIWQSIQYRRGVIHYDGMTKKAYLRLFFAWRPSQNYSKIIDRPIYEFALKNIERSESYYKDRLTPNEKKLFDFVMNIKPLENKLTERNFVNDEDSFHNQLKIIIKNRRGKRSDAYSVVVGGAMSKLKRIIESDSNWYSVIKTEARKKQKPVNEVLNTHVNYLFDKDFPELYQK